LKLKGNIISFNYKRPFIKDVWSGGRRFVHSNADRRRGFSDADIRTYCATSDFLKIMVRPHGQRTVETVRTVGGQFFVILTDIFYERFLFGNRHKRFTVTLFLNIIHIPVLWKYKHTLSIIWSSKPWESEHEPEFSYAYKKHVSLYWGENHQSVSELAVLV